MRAILRMYCRRWGGGGGGGAEESEHTTTTTTTHNLILEYSAPWKLHAWKKPKERKSGVLTNFHMIMLIHNCNPKARAQAQHQHGKKCTARMRD
jgi:hypothetical protein